MIVARLASEPMEIDLDLASALGSDADDAAVGR